MKLYFDGPENKKDGVYFLVAEDGELLYSHLCSNAKFAEGDLVKRRLERQKELRARYGSNIEYEWASLEKSKELILKNKALVEKYETEKSGQRP